MERSYLISPLSSISRNVFISDGLNPETDLSSSFLCGIFKCTKEDFDFVTNNSPFPYVSNKTSASVNSNSITLDTPRCSAGDLLLVFVSIDDSSANWTSTSGWTLETQSSGISKTAIYSRIATGSENSTYTFNSTTTNDIVGGMICIKQWNNYTIGSFGSLANPPTIPVPDDSSSSKLLLFCISTINDSRSWDILTISEFNILLLNSPPVSTSLQLSAIYRTSTNTSLSYTTTQFGGAGNSIGVTVVVK